MMRIQSCFRIRSLVAVRLGCTHVNGSTNRPPCVIQHHNAFKSAGHAPRISQLQRFWDSKRPHLGNSSRFAAPSACSAPYSGDIVRDEPSSLRLTVQHVPSHQAEELSDILLGFGAESVVVQESGTEDADLQLERFTGDGIFDDGSGNQQLWDNCTVQAHFSLAHDMTGTIELAKRVLGQPNLQYKIDEAVPREWIEAIKASYVPLQITPELWIIPDWSEPVDPKAVNIILQPGVAFGTGEHPTTRLCLKHLFSADLEGKTIVDYGTGSGVLAIAALLLGASHAVATDVDELSVRAARHNAEVNGVRDQLQVFSCGPSIEDEDPLIMAGVTTPVDVCVSNILRGPLVELQPRLSGYVKPGGQIILSGILQEQVPEILAAYGDDFHSFDVKTDNGWAMVTATRHDLSVT